MLLIREAGGFATDKAGGQDIFGTGGIVAGNEAIHGALVRALKRPVRAAG
jgi:myo-inositol-1(or 4)-monophosphatase